MSFVRKFIPKTLLVRCMAIIVIPTLIGQGLTIFLFYDRHWYNVSYYTSCAIVNEINWLLEHYNALSEQNSETEMHYLNLSYKFYTDRTLPTKQSKLDEELEIFRNIVNTKIKRKNVVKLDNQKDIQVLFEQDNGIIQITFPTKLLLNPTTYIFILWLIFVTIALLLLSLILLKNQIKSILALTHAADAFGSGGNPRYSPSGAYEIRKAGLAFIKMKERIEKQITKRTQMLAMISHDLRTPLTRIRLQLELMPASHAVNALNQDVDIMMKIITNYLDLAKGEGGEAFQVFTINKLIDDCILKQWSQELKIHLSDHTVEPLKMQIKPIALVRAISNIINNAVKYATEIRINISNTQTEIILEIEDNGIGITDQEKKLVFTPFYRVDKARSINQSSSVGLGLAIAKEIITGHYGSIYLADSVTLGGLLVQIKLPIFTENNV